MSFTPALLRRHRHAAGLTQRQLGALIDRHPHTVRRWELGLIKPSSDVMGALALALGVRIDDLFEEVGNGHHPLSKDQTQPTPERRTEAGQLLTRGGQRAPKVTDPRLLAKAAGVLLAAGDIGGTDDTEADDGQGTE